MTHTADLDRRLVISAESLLRATLTVMLGLSCVSFIEPSPYEIFFFVLAPVAMLAGLSLTQTTLTLFFLVATAISAEVLALTPYFEHYKLEDGVSPTIYTVYTTYLWISALLFAMIFTRHTQARLGITMKAYAFSCVFAGIWGILSYLDVAGIGAREPIVGRIAGPFKDPNVLGSYCIAGAMVFIQGLILAPRRYLPVNLVGLVLTLGGGTFLSFSRGSWGATIFASALLILSTFVTSGRSVRRRIVRALMALLVLGCLAGATLLANDTVRTTITDRFKLAQTYDSGVTGRFGNQERAIPMLMERPLGFGPHRFAVYFDLDPHNSYIGAFASGGWIGGFAYLAIILSTAFLALRLMFLASPFQRLAQVVGSALLALFLQALQIDIDHWRFVVLMIGAVWGLEAARVLARSRATILARRHAASGDEPGLPAAA